MTTRPILQVFSLGSPPWKTIDPFLFCVHHDDAYPEGNGSLGVRASLAGRMIGNDFSVKDGWSMYHGTSVPGFPQHPHRGFETVTFVRRGFIDHSDSLRAGARYGAGDVQWLTAGAGIVHAEMFPMMNEETGNPCEFFQLWLNLPRVDKMAEPHFTMIWAEDVPRFVAKDADGRSVDVTVVAGELGGHVPPSPPPDSWASKPEAEVAIWRLSFDPSAEFALPPARHGVIRVLYVFEGDSLSVLDAGEVSGGHGAVLDASIGVRVRGGSEPTTVLVLQGRPIGEPVAQYGPFVLNDRAGIEQAFRDYQQTGFGGWPWPTDDPTHGSMGRFARRPDGSLELPPGSPVRAG